MTRGQDCWGGLYTEPQLRTMQERWTASLGSGSPARFQPVQYKVTYHVPLKYGRYIYEGDNLANGLKSLPKTLATALKTGCKESHFYSLPFGQAEANIY